MINIVIMAGGKGERFWPKSRIKTPKQLISIISQKTMIEDTIDRVKDLVSIDNVFISTRADLVEPIKAIMPDFPKNNYIIEPMGKDTAACIGLAAVTIAKRDPGSIMIILAADHLIKENDIFINDLKNAAEISQKTGCLITFGIQPSRNETGYGYIETGEVIESEDELQAFEVRKFTEKPDIETAKKFVESGNYLWNSGMFVWTTNAILEAIEKYMPTLFNGLLEIQETIGTPNEDPVKLKIFENLEKISIDYGIMEQADNTLCYKTNFTWDDVGSWTAIERLRDKDSDGNLITGNYKGIDSKNNIINSGNGIVATIGVENLIIINTEDAVLVIDKEHEQDVKKLVKMMGTDETLKRYL
jgi:mannose-1-phosphate guanylyltransferase